MTRTEILEKAKPIILDANEINAIFDGRQTVLRRVVKPQPINTVEEIVTERYHKPHKVGDILYAREVWGTYSPGEKCLPRLYFKASETYPSYIKSYIKPYIKWYSPVTFPKSHARIFLRVADVRMEKLQRISITDEEREECARETDTWVWMIEFERLEAED